MGLGFPRIALWGHFRWKPTGQEFHFYTTHYDFNDEPQVRSSFLIADDARARTARRPLSPLAIVVGDFNSSHLNRDWAFYTGRSPPMD
jgi:endonuclease/exonuclease/phosphatase family metal-dependent hydrolase